MLAGLAAGCSQAPPAGGAAMRTPTPTPLPDAATLLARPMKVPTLVPGSTCPVTPVVSRAMGISNPRGHGPFYLAGPMPQGGFAFNKMVWTLVDGAPAPVLFRGRRIDGAGTLTFEGNQADPAEHGTEPPGYSSHAFYRTIISHGTDDSFYIWPSTIGCYAIQVDGPTFEDVIVVTAVR